MKKEEGTSYTVEREFLAKISAEELLVRIVKSHLKGKADDGCEYRDSEIL